MSSAAALANAIIAQEGTGRLSAVNNNPGNLMFANQTGAVLGQGGFAAFPSYDAGYQALLNQIGLDAGRGLTLQQFIYKYAPPSQNNSAAYLNSVSSQTGIDPNTPLSSALTGGATDSYGDTSSTAQQLEQDQQNVNADPADDVVLAGFDLTQLSQNLPGGNWLYLGLAAACGVAAYLAFK